MALGNLSYTFTNLAGSPLVGYKVRVTHGTGATPAAMFTADGRNLGSYAVTDSEGSINVYVPTGRSYSLVVSDARGYVLGEVSGVASGPFVAVNNNGSRANSDEGDGDGGASAEPVNISWNEELGKFNGPAVRIDVAGSSILGTVSQTPTSSAPGAVWLSAVAAVIADEDGNGSFSVHAPAGWRIAQCVASPTINGMVTAQASVDMDNPPVVRVDWVGEAGTSYHVVMQIALAALPTIESSATTVRPSALEVLLQPRRVPGKGQTVGTADSISFTNIGSVTAIVTVSATGDAVVGNGWTAETGSGDPQILAPGQSTFLRVGSTHYEDGEATSTLHVAVIEAHTFSQTGGGSFGPTGTGTILDEYDIAVKVRSVHGLTLDDTETGNVDLTTSVDQQATAEVVLRNRGLVPLHAPFQLTFDEQIPGLSVGFHSTLPIPPDGTVTMTIYYTPPDELQHGNAINIDTAPFTPGWIASGLHTVNVALNVTV